LSYIPIHNQIITHKRPFIKGRRKRQIK